MITSNRSVGDWGTVFGDPVVATAILDRLLHHSHVVTIRGDSYRLREKLRPDQRSYGATDGRAWVKVRGPTSEPGDRVMEISIKTVPSADAKPAPLFVALELSKACWLVALHAPDVDKVGLYHIDGGDTGRLVTLIEAKRVHAEKKLGRTVRVMCCYEAGHDGFWLHRFLLARGIDNRVLDSASILVNRRARRAKTDRLDAAALLRTLMALELGEQQVCRVVHVPTVADEDRRRLSRERERLLKESTSHISRIKGLLMLHGIRAFVPTGRAWKRRLDALITADGQALPACLKAEIARECRRLELVKELLAEVDREQMQEIEREAGAAQRLIRTSAASEAQGFDLPRERQGWKGPLCLRCEGDAQQL